MEHVELWSIIWNTWSCGANLSRVYLMIYLLYIIISLQLSLSMLGFTASI
jgi:hypothetical protein